MSKLKTNGVYIHKVNKFSLISHFCNLTNDFYGSKPINNFFVIKNFFCGLIFPLISFFLIILLFFHVSFIVYAIWIYHFLIFCFFFNNFWKVLIVIEITAINALCVNINRTHNRTTHIQ